MFKGYAKNSLQWQICGFKLLPWMQSSVTTYEDIKASHYYAGWLCFQVRWYTIN